MDILLGCGSSTGRRISCNRHEWNELTTLDIDDSKSPDTKWDMNNVPLPFPDDSADEIHAYHVLEHVGKAGDWKFFFDQFADFWRMLKPGGFFCGIVPCYDSIWAWGDPGHTRVISSGSLIFLSQVQYAAQVGITAMTDYREHYKGNFESVNYWQDKTDFNFILKAIK